MTVSKVNRDIARRILLKNKIQRLRAADFAALISGLARSLTDKDVGFNHACTDVEGWFKSLAPYGLGLDAAFVEDMLYACNMLDEVGRFEHPLGKSFDDMLRTVLAPGQTFDKDTNEINDSRST